MRLLRMVILEASVRLERLDDPQRAEGAHAHGSEKAMSRIGCSCGLTMPASLTRMSGLVDAAGCVLDRRAVPNVESQQHELPGGGEFAPRRRCLTQIAESAGDTIAQM
jgi:hypothetical protein